MSWSTERFTVKYSANYSSIDPDLTLKFPAMMELFQDTSTRHSEQSHFPMSWFRDNRKGFLLTNWQVEMQRPPVLYEDLTVGTWPCMFKGILGERCFEMRNTSNDEIIARANSRWVFTDLERRRPVKPPQELVEGFGQQFPSAMPMDFLIPCESGAALPEDSEMIYEKVFTSTRRDIDSNSHVNNIKYMEWAIDSIPDEIYDGQFIRRMKTHYISECPKDREVLLKTFRVSHDGFLTEIKDFKSDRLFAVVYSQWVKKG